MSNNSGVASILQKIVDVLNKNETPLLEKMGSASLFDAAKKLSTLGAVINDLAINRASYEVEAVIRGISIEKLVKTDAELDTFLNNCMNDAIMKENEDFKQSMIKFDEMMKASEASKNIKETESKDNPTLPDTPLAKKAEAEFARLGSSSKVTVH